MDEDVFDQQVRRFLKKVGINSQREIERAVQAALESGRWSDTQPLDAQMHLSIPALDLDLVIHEQIALR